MTEVYKYDVAIMGGGPGGYVAGIRAAQLGMKACVIEKEKVGGVCLNWGCIPSKNLIHQAGLFLSIKELKAIGVTVETADMDYTKVHKKSRQTTQTLVKGIEFLLKKNGVDFVPSTARIAGKNKVVLSGGTELSAKHIIVATGSRPFTLPGFEFDEVQVLSSSGVLSMQTLPKSMVILGAGPIGCEFAYVMNAFGVSVTLVEMAERILPFEDEEVVAVLANTFKKKGIDVLTGTRAVKLDKTAAGVTIIVEDSGGVKKTIDAEKALCVFGRIPNTEGIGLETISLETDNGYIPVGDYYQTHVPGVFAIGDVVATPLLAHVASKEGEIAVEFISGLTPEARINLQAVPSAIYCEPQVAGFGLREFQAKEKKIRYKKAAFPFRGAGKAVAVGKPEGLVKVLYDPETQEILGAHIVGADATEMIHELLLAKTGELLPADVSGMVHAHPTLSESLMEIMRAVEDKALHM